MMTQRLLQLLAVSSLAVLASCSMFSSSKPAASTAPHASEEFDPISGTWQPASKVTLPPRAPENAALAEAERKEKSKPGVMKKVGDVVKTPLKWLPWHKSEAEEAANAPKAEPAPEQKKAN